MREKPQVALLDLGMPRMNGYELAGRIRAEAWGRNMTKPADPAQIDAILAGLA